jgi:tetratricopeptide (TPR) repeat protein
LQTVVDSRAQQRRHPLSLLFVLAMSLWMVACASAPEQADPEELAVAAPAETVEPEPAEPPEPVYRPIPDEAVFDMLVAEFAIQRRRFDLALAYYMKQAARTRDVGVTAHALRIARHIGAEEQALQLARLWVELAPDDPQARMSFAEELTRAGRPFEALAQMRVVQERQGRTNFTGIVSASLEGPADERGVMLADIDGLQRRHPESTDLLLAQALLQNSLDRPDAALDSLARLLQIEPSQRQAVVLEARILLQQGNAEGALQRMESMLSETPDDARLRLDYAKLLTQVDMKAAEEQFEILVDSHANDGELILALAMIYRENDRRGPMREQLRHLLAIGQQEDSAHFYLAVDAEENGELERAAEHYFSVGPGRLFGPSIRRGAELLARSGRLDDARARLSQLAAERPQSAADLAMLEANLLGDEGLYDDAYVVLSLAIAADPDNSNLLYARSLVSDRRDDIPGVERDLREILSQNPDSAMALNALGYTLTNKTDRHDEALALISRALELRPNDPAILDSMGWVHYRLGNYELALSYLQRAFSQFPDPEVAAHLGEVLWVLGRQQEARRIWQDALEKSPDSEIVQDTVNRLADQLIEPPRDALEQP